MPFVQLKVAPRELVFLPGCGGAKRLTTIGRRSGMSQGIQTAIAHSSFGESGCCGCLIGIYDGDMSEIVCNECGAVIAFVAPDNLERMLKDMAGEGFQKSSVAGASSG
jgi:hypothetical protein